MKSFKLFFKLIIIILLLSISLTAIIQNLSVATVRFLVFGISAPLIAVILVSIFVGFLLGILTYSFLFKKESRQDEKTNKLRPSKK